MNTTVANDIVKAPGYKTTAVCDDKPFYDFTKRTFDILLSFFALIILLVPMMLIAIIIKCDSRGPVFYKQERLGLGGKSFMLYKFRTMVEDAEKNGAKWADENDDRITRSGKWLRLFRIDEIPQFFNILKGDVSLVGPRPEREFFHKQFCEEIEGWENRLNVKQGLTGLAQVNGGYSLTPAQKLVYDLEYIEKRSIIFDLKIIFKTVLVVLNHNGAR